MGSLFDDLEKGLQEAIDFEKGRGKAKTTTLMIEPVKNTLMRISNGSEMKPA